MKKIKKILFILCSFALMSCGMKCETCHDKHEIKCTRCNEAGIANCIICGGMGS